MNIPQLSRLEKQQFVENHNKESAEKKQRLIYLKAISIITYIATIVIMTSTQTPNFALALPSAFICLVSSAPLLAEFERDDPEFISLIVNDPHFFEFCRIKNKTPQQTINYFRCPGFRTNDALAEQARKVENFQQFGKERDRLACSHEMMRAKPL